MPVIIFSLDPNATFTLAEGRGLQALDLTAGDLVGRSAFEVFKDAPEAGESIRRALAGEPHVSVISTRGRRLHVWHCPLAGPAPSLAGGVIGVAMDVTERERAEAERLEMERRLLHTQKLESLGVLAGGIAHDFNNLLTVILGNLELVSLDLPKTSIMRANLDNAANATCRAADLTRQMLAYSGRGRFVIKDVDLSELVREMTQLLKVSIAKTANLELHLAPDLPRVQADAAQVQQVVMNLITNASEALGDSPGTIVLTTGHQFCDQEYLGGSRTAEKAAPGRFVFLEVTDDGCGMDEHVQQRLFDPFFTTKFTGRGLGMSAVLGVMRGHKGAILLSSEVERGTTVRVLFPLGQSDGQPRALHGLSGNGGKDELRETPDKVRLSGTVLVVDDEEPVRKLAGQVLERIGCNVLAAADGQEAVQVFRQCAGEIGCVLLDLTMPAMDGMRTYGELRALRPDVRVILASGFDEVEISQRYAGQGLAGFIQKPYQLSTLTEEVRRVLAG